MSLDKTLRSKSTLERHRNVLTRAERMERLQEINRWTEGQSVLGMPKVAHRKAAVGKKSKAEKKEAAAAEGDKAKAPAKKPG